MYSYLDIKRRENELLEKIDSIKKERIDLVSPFYELKKQYPDTFGVLLDNYEGLESEKFDTRLEILIENIETSNLENKDELITSIGNVRDRFKVINNKERMYNRFLNESVSPEKEKRENYLREVYIKTRIIEKKLEKNNLLIKEYEVKRNELIEKGFESKIINAFNNVIDYDLHNANERLKNELRKLYIETGLSEEIEAYYKDNEKELDYIARDISKEILGESKKEKVDNVITSNSIISEDDKETIQLEEQGKVTFKDHEETTQNLAIILPEKTELVATKKDEIPEVKEQDFVIVEDSKSDGKESDKEEEKNKSQLDAIIPETTKKVINIHKASPELMKKIVKNGSIALGVVAIASAVFAVLSNPVLIGNVALAALGGGLITSQIEEKALKK